MLKRPHYIALGLVVLLTLVMLNLPSQATARLKLGIGSLFLPLFGLANSTQQMTEKAADAMLPKGELLKQLDGLRRENEKLLLQVQQSEETTRENNRLRQLLGWQQKRPWKLKLANVVLHDPANFWRTVQIDLGSRDGVSTNLPVLTPDGSLAGRISSVSLTRSQVVLIGDPNCKVAARVENETRDSGVIGPARPLDSEFVEMGYLPKTSTVRPGQKVKTSGDGGIFPKDISIGQVMDVHSADSGLATAARVKLGADLRGLEEVWVLFP